MPTSDAVCGSPHCLTCGDVGDPNTVVAVDAARELALCTGPGGECSTVEIALVSPVAPGDVNDDGVTDLQDAVATSRMFTGLDGSEPFARSRADVEPFDPGRAFTGHRGGRGVSK